MNLDPSNNPLRMAYLLSCYPKRSEAFIHREVTALRRRGVALHTASINAPDVPKEELPPEERHACVDTLYVKSQGIGRAALATLAEFARRPVRVARVLFSALRASNDLRGLLWAPFYLVEAILVGRWMRAARIDHLHSHFGSAASTVALLVHELFDVTLSWTLHGPDELYEVERHRLADKVRAATFVSCISNYARSQLMRLVTPEHWDKLEVARLGVDVRQFAPQPRVVRSQRTEILCVGRLVPAKGQHLLVQAVAALRASGRDARLSLVGDGPDRGSLEAMVRSLGLTDAVTFTGGVGQDRIRSLYARADIFALPSFAEGLPVVLMEAMAMGIPVVSTHITGIPELIQDGVNGLLVPASDEAALVDALRRLHDDAPLRRRLGSAGRVTVGESYDLERNVDRLHAVMLRRLVGHDGIDAVELAHAA